MRKNFNIIMIFLMVFVIVSCKNTSEEKKQTSEISPTAATTSLISSEVENLIESSFNESISTQELKQIYGEINANENINIDGMVLLKEDKDFNFKYDENASIKLYVDEGAYDGENLMLDDSQNWALIFSCSKGDFALYKKNIIYLGELSAEIFMDFEEIDKNKNPYLHILVKEYGGAYVKIIDYKFNSEKNTFDYEPIYEKTNISFQGEVRGNYN